MTKINNSIEFLPVCAENWEDLEALFGAHGAREGCWCMRWRLPKAQFQQKLGDQNRLALQKGIAKGEILGILGYAGDEPIAWCSLGPRESFLGLHESHILAPVDEQPVWSIACFFIKKGHRLKGLSVQLLKAAVEYARSHEVDVLEGYPVIPIKTKIPVAFAWSGFERTFIEAGFKEVERRAPIRPIMRCQLRS